MSISTLFILLIALGVGCVIATDGILNLTAIIDVEDEDDGEFDFNIVENSDNANGKPPEIGKIKVPAAVIEAIGNLNGHVTGDHIKLQADIRQVSEGVELETGNFDDENSEFEIIEVIASKTAPASTVGSNRYDKISGTWTNGKLHRLFKTSGRTALDAKIVYLLANKTLIQKKNTVPEINTEIKLKLDKGDKNLLKYDTERDEDYYGCTISSLFKKNMNYRNVFVKGDAYAFGDSVLVVGYDYVRLYASDFVRTFSDSICIQDRAFATFEFVLPEERAVCITQMMLPRFEDKCKDSCASKTYKFHSSKTGCCDCTHSVRAVDEWELWREFFGTLFIVTEGNDMGFFYRIKTLASNPYSLHVFADILGIMGALLPSYPCYFGSIVVNILATIYLRSSYGVLALIFKTTFLYPSVKAVDSLSADIKALLTAYGAGLTLVTSVALEPSVYTLTLTCVWYVVIVLLLSTSNIITVPGQTRSHVFIGLFLLNGASDLIINALEILTEEKRRGAAMVVLYMLASPLKTTGMLFSNVIDTTEKVMATAPITLQRVFGNDMWIYVMFITVAWNVLFVYWIRSSLTSLTFTTRTRSIYLNDSPLLSFAWYAQVLVDLPSMKDYRDIMLFIIILMRGGGGIELVILSCVVYAFSTTVDNTRFLTKEEHAAVVKDLEVKRIRNQQGVLRKTSLQTREMPTDSHAITLGEHEIDKQVVVDIPAVIDAVVESYQHTARVSPNQEKRPEVTVTATHKEVTKLGGGAFVRTTGRNPMLLFVTIGHILRSYWDNAALHSTVDNIKIDGGIATIIKDSEIKITDVVKDRAVALRIPEALKVTTKVATTKRPEEGMGVYLTGVGNRRHGTCSHVKSGTWVINGIDVTYSESGYGVYDSASQDPVLVGVICARSTLENKKAVYFEAVHSMQIIGGIESMEPPPPTEFGKKALAIEDRLRPKKEIMVPTASKSVKQKFKSRYVPKVVESEDDIDALYLPLSVVPDDDGGNLNYVKDEELFTEDVPEHPMVLMPRPVRNNAPRQGRNGIGYGGDARGNAYA